MGLPRTARWLYLTATAIFVADRLSKWFATSYLADRPPVRVVSGVLHLTYTTNTGGAFGIFDKAPWLFAAATLVISAAIVRSSFRVSRLSPAVAMGLILGGALGNLADRISGGWSLSGKVTDFIDFRIWPVFNLADSAIVVGAALLVFVTARSGAGRAQPAESNPKEGKISDAAGTGSADDGSG